MKNILNKKWKTRLTNIFNSREKLSREDFVKVLVSKGYKQESVEVVYENIATYLPQSINISMYPDDDLINDYDIDNEDLEDIIKKIFKKLNSPIPDRKSQRIFYEENGTKLTLERIIHFIDYFKSK